MPRERATLATSLSRVVTEPFLASGKTRVLSWRRWKAEERISRSSRVN